MAAPEKQVNQTESRQATKEGVGRYVLTISFALAAVALVIAFFVVT
ncbi:hypothetical protein GGE65_001718 [Skermanella aerolata]|jgi:hypothetical protein|uniref:Uncharacterized protein n=1 Tax=Skermanella aerolata TaxID=393310 RepID=A0A512DKI0_9PROT|nr:hypothetical protein [Skermanella aerolata]KJB97178.1 hypothetical protein N826_28165 [Skermanella aerolata KACC 11604]GEO36981.1 hypothetical protein SAE02_11290 [Skermanella aerolata]HYI70899.1 hypothetical protein [Skermanella sp.]